IDVVHIADMTSMDHIERELALLKLSVDGDTSALERVLEQFDVRVLDDKGPHMTVELVGGGQDIDRFIARAGRAARIVSVVRSGAMRSARAAGPAGGAWSPRRFRSTSLAMTAATASNSNADRLLAGRRIVVKIGSALFVEQQTGALDRAWL